MKIAVISDIHGNCVALDAVLQDLKSEAVDRVVCLGDAIQGGPQPAETVQCLRQLGAPVVMGNADSFLLTGKDEGSTEEVTAAQLKVREWTLSQLSTTDIEFITSFQPTVELHLDNDTDLLCFHGSPRSFNEIIFPETPEEEFQRMVGGYTGSILCGGHTHLQQVRRVGDFFFFNPGSIGFAYNRNQPEESFRLDTWAEYAVLTYPSVQKETCVSLEFRRVPFSVDKLLQIYRLSGRPHSEGIITQYGGDLASHNQ